MLLCSIMALSCTAQVKGPFKAKIVYQSDDLIITRIAENTFEHTSYLSTRDFGKVPCNGLVVRDGNEAIVMDATADDKSSGELIDWIKQQLQCKINAIIPTHFHADCLGGLQAFHDAHIPSYASFKTIAFAKEHHFVVPENGFNDSLILKAGNEQIIARFFGEGHTKDNIVVYFPKDKMLFGGCLIKELKAGKGNLEDANVAEWPATVERVKREYADAAIVVPGHGRYGGAELLDYTIGLFRN